MSSPQVERNLAPHLEKCFFFDAVESSYQIADITGQIPAWLRGSYYVNGPARFQRGSFRYRHWLDGDGMVCALHFTDQGVQFVSRFVRTRKMRDEEAAGQPVYRAFGTAFPGDRLRNNVMLEAPVNVTAYPYAGAVLAFGEQTLPVELDPITLETRKQYDFQGGLNGFSPFAAHAKFDPQTGYMFNFGTSYAARTPAFHIYEFDVAGRLLARRRHPLPAPHSVHDFGLSDSHFVFFLSPLLMDFEFFISKSSSVFDALRWRPEIGSRILVVPRGAAEPAFSVETGGAYCLHMINCFAQDGRLLVDIIELDAPIYPEYQPLPELFVNAPPGRPVRYVIDLRSRALLDRFALPYDRTPDFPSIDPGLMSREYENFWLLGLSASGTPGRKFFDQLVRCGWRAGGPEDSYQVPQGEYLAGEPAFAGNPLSPREGVLIVQHLRPEAGNAEFLLFQAFDLSAGPIARLPLKSLLHPGFHASFRHT